MEPRFLEICKLVALGSAKDYPPSTLSQNLEQFINSEDLSDLIIVVEDTPIYVHKMIVCRCEYFRAMFLLGFKEASQSKTMLQDISLASFMQIVRYLYMDEAPIQTPDETIEVKYIKISIHYKHLPAVTRSTSTQNIQYQTNNIFNSLYPNIPGCTISLKFSLMLKNVII
jgi:hypothetical protein